MYIELDNYLLGNLPVDYWYDEGFSIACEMLRKFAQEDWEILSREVLNKPPDYQRKLAYCIDNSSGNYGLSILLSLGDTDDEELFEICVDSLRAFSSTSDKEKNTDGNVQIKLRGDKTMAPNESFMRDYPEIQRLCGKGSKYADRGKLPKAIQCYEEALQLLPEPKEQWESGTWLYSSLGDAQFKQGAYPEAIDNLEISQKCPGGSSDPFITLRLGQCYYEIGDRKKAEELMLQTFDVGGPDYFEHEDPKYFDLIAHLPY